MQSVAEIFDELLSQVDYVPSLAIKFCCKDGKTQTLAKILESFPNISDEDGKATRTANETHEADSNFSDLFESSQVYQKDLDELLDETRPSALSIAIMHQNK